MVEQHPSKWLNSTQCDAPSYSTGESAISMLYHLTLDRWVLIIAGVLFKHAQLASVVVTQKIIDLHFLLAALFTAATVTVASVFITAFVQNSLQGFHKTAIRLPKAFHKTSIRPPQTFRLQKKSQTSTRLIVQTTSTRLSQELFFRHFQESSCSGYFQKTVYSTHQAVNHLMPSEGGCLAVKALICFAHCACWAASR